MLFWRYFFVFSNFSLASFLSRNFGKSKGLFKSLSSKFSQAHKKGFSIVPSILAPPSVQL